MPYFVVFVVVFCFVFVFIFCLFACCLFVCFVGFHKNTKFCHDKMRSLRINGTIAHNILLQNNVKNYKRLILNQKKEIWVS